MWVQLDSMCVHGYINDVKFITIDYVMVSYSCSQHLIRNSVVDITRGYVVTSNNFLLLGEVTTVIYRHIATEFIS